MGKLWENEHLPRRRDIFFYFSVEMCRQFRTWLSSYFYISVILDVISWHFKIIWL